MFKVFLLFFLRFISHSFLFFVFPSMKRVFLAFLVHKTVCNLPSKDFHMQTVRGEGRGSAGGEFPSTLSSCRDWCVIIFMLLKKHFQCVIIKKRTTTWGRTTTTCVPSSTPLFPPPLSPVHSSVCRYLFSLHGGVRLDFCLLQFGCQKSTDRHLLFYTSCRCCSCCCCCFCCAKRNYTLMNCLISCSQ